MIEVGPNFIARPYRGVSVQDVGALDEAALRALADRPAACTGGPSSSSRCAAASARSCRSSATTRRRASSPRPRRARARRARTRSRSSPTRRSTRATPARWRAPRARGGARVTVVQGRFEHVNFIVEPAPLRVRVVEVVPPEPPKLLEMARAVLDYDEDLPPVTLDFEAIDLRELAARTGRALPVPVPLLRARRAVDFLDAGPPELGRLDAGRLRALAPDPRGAVRRASRTRASTSARSRSTAPGRRHAGQVLPARARDRARRARRWSCRGARRLEEVRAALRGLVGVDGIESSTAICGAPTRRARCSSDAGRTQIWLEIIAALAAAQARARADPRRRRARRSPRRCESRRPRGRRRARRAAAATRRSG